MWRARLLELSRRDVVVGSLPCFVVFRSSSAVISALHQVGSNVMFSSICCRTLLYPGFCLLWQACLVVSRSLSAVRFFEFSRYSMVFGLLLCELWVVVCYIFLVLLLMSSRSRVCCYALLCPGFHLLWHLLICLFWLWKRYGEDVLLSPILTTICIPVLVVWFQRHWWLVLLSFFASVVSRALLLLASCPLTSLSHLLFDSSCLL